MPEHIKALVVILGLASVVFALAKAPACALACPVADFERRRNLWFAITLIAFLAHDFWSYIVIVATVLIIALPREPNKLAIFFFLLFTVPAFRGAITGLGLIQQLFTIDYIRLLALTILVPAYLSVSRQPGVERFGQTLPDKFLAAYLVLNIVLMLNVSTFTNTLRHGVFYAFIDVFLPYYVASRSLSDLKRFRDVLMGFVVAAMVLGAIGTFEFVRHWLLYAALEHALGVRSEFGVYLERGDGTLRAQATTVHPIALGYVMAVGTGLFLYLRRSVPNKMLWGLGLILLIAGLIASVSRGPWLGAVVMLLVFIATGGSPVTGFARFALLGVITLPVLLISPVGEAIIAYLPFIGTIDAESITYRQRLLEISVQVLMQNPFLGAHNYYLSPEMQDLKQGQGIIDIVNTYLGVALSSGLIGLSLFSGFFIAVAAGVFRGMRTLADRNSELYLLGQVLFSVLLGIMVIIFTVSSISVIPVIYWSMSGIGVAYARMLAARQTAVRPSGTAVDDGVLSPALKAGSYFQYWSDSPKTNKD